MRSLMPELDGTPLGTLCRRVGASRHASAAMAALCAAVAAGHSNPGLASGCVAVAIVVAADKVQSLAARRPRRGVPDGRDGLAAGLAAMLAAARGEDSDRFWLVRHAEGATEAMTPSAFGRFARVMAQGMRRILMVDPDSELRTNLDAPASLSRRVSVREAAFLRQAALSRLTARPMDCVLVAAFDDVEQREIPAKVDVSTGILEPLVLPTDVNGPLTQAYLVFDDGGEYMLGQLPDGRFHVIDMPGFEAGLAPAPAA